MRRLLVFPILLLLVAPTASATDLVATGFSFSTGWTTTGGAFNANTGMLWWHEHFQGRMHEYTVTGTPTGNVVNTPGDPDVHGLAYNPMTDRFWLSEAGPNVIEFTPLGVQTFSFPGPTSDQTGLTVDKGTGNLYWTSFSSRTIYEFLQNGTQVRTFGSVTNPLSLEHLPQPNTVLVADNADNLTELNLDGTVANTWSISGLLGGRSVRIRAMGFDAANCRLYLANEDDAIVYELQDMDCGATPVEQTTWGAIKSSYR